MILRRLVLSPRLHAMVPMAKGLPVASIPEELLVTTVRNDVVDVRRLLIPSFLHALHAQRVLPKVLLPGLSPGSSIASSSSGPYLFLVQCFMAITVLLP